MVKRGRRRDGVRSKQVVAVDIRGTKEPLLQQLLNVKALRVVAEHRGPDNLRSRFRLVVAASHLVVQRLPWANHLLRGRVDDEHDVNERVAVVVSVHRVVVVVVG